MLIMYNTYTYDHGDDDDFFVMNATLSGVFCHGCRLYYLRGVALTSTLKGGAPGVARLRVRCLQLGQSKMRFGPSMSVWLSFSWLYKNIFANYLRFLSES